MNRVNSPETEIALLQAENERLRGCLEQCCQVLNDSIILYAPDMCDQSQVKEVQQRVSSNGGFLFCIGHALKDARTLLYKN